MMTYPDWWEFHTVIEGNSDLIDRFSDILLNNGALAVSIEDNESNLPTEKPIFAEPSSPQLLKHTSSTPIPVATSTEIDHVDSEFQHWKLNTIKILFDTKNWTIVNCVDLINRCASGLGIKLDKLNPPLELFNEDWVRKTQNQFSPIQISNRVTVLPSWHSSYAEENSNSSHINLIIDPGLAFGSGSHATTFLCLQFIERHFNAGQSLLDYGCGSGILSLLACRLGASSVIATDIDEQAFKTTQENAILNKCVLTTSLLSNLNEHLEGLPDNRCDWVVANILTQPLIALAPLLTQYLAQDGTLLLSGILDSQSKEVIAAYSPFCTLSVYDRKDGWTCLSNQHT